MAYAAEMADMENHRCISWSLTWASLHDRAQMVLKSHLNDKGSDDSEGIPIPKLTVELDFEDGQDFLDEFSDTD